MERWSIPVLIMVMAGGPAWAKPSGETHDAPSDGGQDASKLDVSKSTTELTRTSLTSPSSGTVDNQWSVYIDRRILVDMTSEVSVRGCEAAFEKGANACVLIGDGCTSIRYASDAPTKEAIKYLVAPAFCGGALPGPPSARADGGSTPLAWRAFSPAHELVDTIPVMSAGSLDATEPK